MSKLNPRRDRVHAPITVDDDRVWFPENAKEVARLVEEGKAPGGENEGRKWRFEDVLFCVLFGVAAVALCVLVALVIAARMRG